MNESAKEHNSFRECKNNTEMTSFPFFYSI